MTWVLLHVDYMIVYVRKRVWKGGRVVYGSQELKSKFHRSRELKQAFLESRKIQRLILFVAHIVLQNWGVDYFEFYIHKQ